MYDNYRTTYTTRPKMGSPKPQGTRISEEIMAQCLRLGIQSMDDLRKWAAPILEEQARREAGARRLDKARQVQIERGKKTDKAVLSQLEKGPATYAEIGAALGMNPNTVKGSVSRLRKSGTAIARKREGLRQWVELEATS